MAVPAESLSLAGSKNNYFAVDHGAYAEENGVESTVPATPSYVASDLRGTLADTTPTEIPSVLSSADVGVTSL